MKNKSKESKESKKILEQIRTVRKQRGLIQEKVAKVIGVERSTYVRKEAGAIPLTLVEFLKITDFLDIDVSMTVGDLALKAQVPSEILKLVEMIEAIPPSDRSYILESTKSLIKHTRRK